MKKVITLAASLVFSLVLILPSTSVYAHPGNTASDGCHYCRTNCESWGEVYGERHCHGGGSYTPLPTYPSTPSCPFNSYYDYSSSTCRCNYGYVADESGTSCLSKDAHCKNTYGYNSSHDVLSGSCACSSGYELDDTTYGKSQCVSCYSKYGLNSKWDYLRDQCVCSDGYYFKKNIIGNGYSCEREAETFLPTLPALPTLPPTTCYDYVNGYLGSDSNCYCNTGYVWSDASLKCVKPEISTPLPITTPTDNFVPISGKAKTPNTISQLWNSSKISTLDLQPTSSIGIDRGVAATATNAACNADTLIKGSLAAVYYCGADGKRYVFPDKKTYDSWYSDFDGVTQMTDLQVASIVIGGNVTYRPGIRMIKIVSSPIVYAVSKGGVLRAIASENVAQELYGPNWNQFINDVPDAFFTNYTIGPALDFNGS